MKRSPEGVGPTVTLDRRLRRPLHCQLYDGYREAILDGRLRPGQRLPSTRILAEELHISRAPEREIELARNFFSTTAPGTARRCRTFASKAPLRAARDLVRCAAAAGHTGWRSRTLVRHGR